MRIVKEVNYAEFKITIFHWNNRYLIKLEQGFLEQTYKIDQFEISDEDALAKVLDATFLAEATERFLDMANSFRRALQRA